MSATKPTRQSRRVPGQTTNHLAAAPPPSVSGAGVLVDDDKLRRAVAEYVFKKGLVSSGDIVRDCGVDAVIVNDFMNHPWFVSHMQKWRLTPAGKNEGIDY